MDFQEWWASFGSAMRPHRNEDREEHARRVAEAAWDIAATFGKPLDFDGLTIHEAPEGFTMEPVKGNTLEAPKG